MINKKFLDFMTETEAHDLHIKIKIQLSDVFSKTWIKKEYKINSQYGWHVFGIIPAEMTSNKISRVLDFAVTNGNVDFIIKNKNMVKFI